MNYPTDPRIWLFLAEMRLYHDRDYPAARVACRAAFEACSIARMQLQSIINAGYHHEDKLHRLDLIWLHVRAPNVSYIADRIHGWSNCMPATWPETRSVCTLFPAIGAADLQRAWDCEYMPGLYTGGSLPLRFSCCRPHNATAACMHEQESSGNTTCRADPHHRGCSGVAR